MLILKLLLIAILAYSWYRLLAVVKKPYTRIESQPSVYERVLDWALDIDNRLKNFRQLSDAELQLALGELKQWHFLLRNIPAEDGNGLTLVKK
ncbi:hypothetical protein KIH87_07290 [Paraneptunicella aestuarii]|uniref:hypothetical protein n=1 Tax=Paraneptunicella aestuarii TaxID=2831148 RepID=UPI001E5BC575|nr:hypothetical protein [Paraneptunicella aestuarii]UAA40142.1 hypothetical protein KIH87_07290 [Paraneptunicella aestuarii]